MSNRQVVFLSGVRSTNAGHGSGTPASKTISQYADIFAFTLYNMGVKKLKN